MPEHEDAFEANEADVENYGDGSSPRPRQGSHGAPDVDGDSKSQV